MQKGICMYIHTYVKGLCKIERIENLKVCFPYVHQRKLLCIFLVYFPQKVERLYYKYTINVRNNCKISIKLQLNKEIVQQKLYC